MPESTSVLVGRRVEVDALRRTIAGLDTEGQGVVQIVGEQGIGKTRLVGEVCSMAEGLHHLVFSGRAAEFEQDEPFGVFIDALDDYLGSMDHRELERRDLELDELGLVLPALGRLAGRPPMATPAERAGAHRAVRVLLEVLSERRPVVLALDDLHWADAASADLAAFLVRRPPRGRVLMVMAFRPTQLPTRLDVMLHAATHTPRLLRLGLDPLTRDEARQLLGPDVQDPTADELYGLSGGNPFYLHELGRSTHRLANRTFGAGESDVVAPIPAAVQAVLASELGSLSPQSRVDSGAAVAGDPFEVGLAAAVGELPEGHEFEALDGLLDADLVRPCPVPRRFEFRHPLVRHAVYQSAGAGWRIMAHARAVKVLEARGASAASPARHIELSARPGDQSAVTKLIGAGDATLRRAPATAARWYEAALGLMPETPAERSVRLDVLVKLARTQAGVGRLEESRAAFLEALDLVPPDATALRVELNAGCAAVEQHLGRHGDADRRLRQAVTELPHPVSEEAAASNIALSLAARYAGDPAGMRARAQEALEAAASAGARALQANAAALGAYAAAESAGEVPLHAVLGQAEELVDRLTDEELAARLESAHYLGWAELMAGRYAAAERYMQRGFDVARASGQSQHLLQPLLGQAVILTYRGNIREATDAVTSAVETARLSGNAQSLAWALSLECRVATCRGDLDFAVHCGEEAVTLARGLAQPWITALVGSGLALTRLEAGDAELGRTELLEWGGGPDLPQDGVQQKCHSYEALTRAELALGRCEEADDWTRRAEAVDTTGDPLATAVTRLARARVLLAQGAPHEAAAKALEAADMQDEVGTRLLAAQSRTLAGRALAAAGRRDEGVALLERAEAELTGCGAARYADEAARELRRLGRRVVRRRRVSGAGELGLSRRELEVAQLVTAGKSNREIAAELFLSEKTIESHLYKVFAKLGVS